MTSDLQASVTSPEFVYAAPVGAVLLVHAGAGLRERLRERLSRDGCLVAAAASFHDAARMIASFRPDLLVADVRLGAYNGLHVAVRARRAYPDLPVIVTYDVLDRILERDARRMDMAFIGRPLSNPAFLEHVRAALRPSRSLPA